MYWKVTIFLIFSNYLFLLAKGALKVGKLGRRTIVKRKEIDLFRLTMIFTALRKFENGDTSTSAFSTDADIGTAVNLADLYLQHSLLMFHNLPKQTENAVFRSGDNKRKFFDALPSDFKRAEAIELGKRHNLSTRSVDNLLKELTGRYLSQPQYGCYSKL